MKDILLIIYEMLTVMIPVMFTALFFTLYYRKKRFPLGWEYYIWIFVLSIYTIFIRRITSAGTLYDILRNSSHAVPFHVQVILFYYSGDINPIAFGLNILLFVPLGFIISMTWPDTAKASFVIPVGLCWSLLIDMSQLLSNGKTDIDGLILNTIGVAAGYIIVKLLFNGYIQKRCNSVRIMSEPILYLSIMFFSRFFLFDEMGASSFIYSF